MGWLYMESLKGYAGPRQYLDAQYTYDRPDLRSRVLRSALVGMRVYYAAVERIALPHGERAVWAAVCLVNYNRRARDGYIFGYKDMDESMGPCESDCPAAILDLLTPTTKDYALAWRARCRANLAARRAKPKLRPGQIVVFDQPIAFMDGRTCDRFEVVAHPWSPRALRFRVPGSPGLYRISNLRMRAYRILDAQAPMPEAAE